MKILYSAFSCNPNRGSEAYCGWSWPITMYPHNDTFIITRPDNKYDIEKYLKDNSISNLKVYYCDSKLGKKLNLSKAMFFMVYYVLWQRAAYKEVKRLHKVHKFEYIHHVSLGDFRFVGKLWRIDSRFIFGPVGGAQITPKPLKHYTKSHNFVEYFRRLVNFTITRSINYRRALKRAYLVLAANQETGDYIAKRQKNINLKLMTENGITRKYLEGIPESYDKLTSKTKIIWSGRLIYRKGLSFLIDIISLIDKGLNYELQIYGDGPEKQFLEDKVKLLFLDDKVKFMGGVPYHIMQEAYQEGQIFVFPSIRETTGTVLFEAMANKLAIVSLNQNGAKLLVDNSCGLLIDVENRTLEEVKKDFAEKLTYLINNPEVCLKMGQEGKKRIMHNFTWESKIKDFLNREINV